jgi:hypothetical protein
MSANIEIVDNELDEVSGVSLIETVPVDLNIIELPLFTKSTHPIKNELTYHLSKTRNARMSILPSIGGCQPNSFDKKVYLALVQIAKRIQEDYNLESIPEEICTTFYEIEKYTKLSRSGRNKQKIFDSIVKLKSTQYNFWNCFYNPSHEEKIESYYASSFINDVTIIKISNIQNNPDHKFYKFVKSKSSSVFVRQQGSLDAEVVVITLHHFFLNNLIHKKGHLLHRREDIEKLMITDTTKMDIYLFAEKNRSWHNGDEYKNGLMVNNRFYKQNQIIRLSARKIASHLPLNFKPNGIPKSCKIIYDALVYLKEKNLIADFIEYKGGKLDELKLNIRERGINDDWVLSSKFRNTLDNTEYEIFFDWSRNEDHILNRSTEIIGIEYKESENNIEYDIILLKICEKIKDKISPQTMRIINEYYQLKGIHYVAGSINYAYKNSTKNFEKYLVDTLNGNWATEEIHKLIHAEKLDQEVTIKLQQQLEKKQADTRIRQQLEKDSELFFKDIEKKWKLLSKVEENSDKLKKIASKANLFYNKNFSENKKFTQRYVELCIFALILNNENVRYLDPNIKLLLMSINGSYIPSDVSFSD